MTDWSVPNWEPWEPDIEVPLLQALAAKVAAAWPHIEGRPDFSTVGAAVVEFFSGPVCIARACVSALDPSAPLFSCYLGALEDEFHGHNIEAIASLVGHYTDALPDTEI